MSLVKARRNLEHMLPIVLWGFVGIFVFGAIAATNPGGSSGIAPSANAGAFARIDGQEIPRQRFAMGVEQGLDQARQYAQFGGQAITVQQLAQVPSMAYDRLVEEYAQASAARAHGIQVTEGDAVKEANRQIDQMLEQRGQGSTKQELKEARAIMRGSVDLESVKRRLLAQRLQEKLMGEARPVEVKVAHVLIKAEPGKRTEADALRVAQDIARRARTGEDFAKLAKDNSEDTGSKASGGVAGWASAQPPMPDPKKPRSPDDAQQFVPEFTAAALRLKPNEVSDPVKSQFGYHVIKAVQQRDYQPKETDPKKRDEALQSYRSQVANQIVQGMFDSARGRIQASVEPMSPWLRGYMKEKQLDPAAPGKTTKPADEAKRLAPVIAEYEAAFKEGDPAVGAGLAYHLSELYGKTGEHQKAVDLLNKWTKKSGDAEVYFALGEHLEKLSKKTEALDAYKEGLDRAFNNPDVLMRLGDRFKALGHPELAQQAKTKQLAQLARQAEAQKQRDEQMKAMMAEQAKASTKVSTKPAGPATKPGDVVSEVTVKTGDVDPKTGKPKILSVESKDPKTGQVKVTHPGERKGAPDPHAGHNHKPGEKH